MEEFKDQLPSDEVRRHLGTSYTVALFTLHYFTLFYFHTTIQYKSTVCLRQQIANKSQRLIAVSGATLQVGNQTTAGVLIVATSILCVRCCWWGFAIDCFI